MSFSYLKYLEAREKYIKLDYSLSEADSKAYEETKEKQMVENGLYITVKEP